MDSAACRRTPAKASPDGTGQSPAPVFSGGGSGGYRSWKAATTAIVTVRLRVEDRELTEAEWYIARENDPGLSGPRQPGRPPANLHNPEYLRCIRRARRLCRPSSAWIARRWAASSTATSTRSRRMTVRSLSRTRVVAARKMASPAPGGAFLPPDPYARDSAPGRPAPQQPGAAIRGCVDGLENFNAVMVAARRIPLIDEEAQIVLATGVFIRKPDRRHRAMSPAGGS